MKKLLLVFFTINCFAQAPAIEWQMSYGGSNFDYPRNSLMTSDGGYIMFGYSSSNDGNITNNHGSFDFWVIKINEFGELQWQKTLGGSNAEYGESIRETSDGYIVVGNTYSNDGDVNGLNGVNSDAWIVKLNYYGEIQWQKTMGNSGNDRATNIITTSDGGYIVTAEKNMGIQQGTTYYETAQYWIIKIGSEGNTQWEKTYGGIGNSIPYDILQTSDGGYVVLGETSSHNGDVIGNHGPLESVDIWLLKLNSIGDIIWQSCYGGSGYERGFKIIETNNNGFIIAGDSDSNDGDLMGTIHNGYSDIWIIKIDSIGVIEWQKNYGGSFTNYAFDIFQTSDNGYVFAGYTDSIDGDVIGNHGSCDAWVVKISSSGTIQWQKTIGGSECDAALNIKPSSDGGYFMSGYNSSNDGDATENNGSRDFWAVKLFPEQLSITTFQQENMTVYPNPTNNILNLKFPNDDVIESLIISDFLGKEVLNSNENLKQINVNNLSKGFYIINASSSFKKYQSKFIKQ